jgi:tetraacyldisaccharide 4'-kinase
MISFKLRRPLLLPLVPLYAAGLALKQRLRAGQNWLTSPVISIGSVSAGGAGKTPMTLLLAELLRRRSLAPAILTRGYKRGLDTIERVDPAGDAARFGDEPLLMARRSVAPVYVGSDRYLAGLLAERDANRPIVPLLDDGFQHGRLGRDADIVLLTQYDVDDMLLPAGDLREPLAGLRRADIVVLREEEAQLADSLHRFVDTRRPPAVWIVRRSLSFPTGSALSKRPLVFCGIARPEGFATMLRAERCEPVEIALFNDHHAYTEGEIDTLVSHAQRTNADGFVTTEKDAVKLSPGMRARLEAIGPVVVPRLDVHLADEDAAIDRLLALVMERQHRRLKLKP